jgi:hypothetical protein
MSVNPQPDGSFRAMLYEGDYRFASASNLPAGMTLKSAKFGSVDVLREPVRISSRDNPEFQLVVESSGATRRSVSGRVRGIEDPQALAAARVSLQSSSYAITETAVVARDGSFEFPALSPGDYLARVLAPGVSLVSSQPTRIVVSDKDVRDIEITVQGQRTLVGTVSVEGGGSIPRVGLRLMVKTATSSSSSTVTLSPQNDGSFRVNVPEREITVDIPQPPPGYLVKSLTYGKTDLTKTPLNIASADSIEDLHIVLAANNGISYVSVSGRVTGFIGSTRNTRVALTSGPSRIETPLNDDGSFRFPQVYQGNYRLSLVGVLYATPPAPAPITVGAKDVTGVVIAFPRSFLVRGRILMNGEVNKLPEQINLEVRNAQGQVVSRTVANGSFSLTLGEGLHNIAVRDLPEGYTLESLAYDSTDLLKTGLNLDAPPDKEILVRLVKASAAGPSPGGGVRVSGKVTGAPDTIPYPRKLLVSGPGPSDLREVALDNKGNFEFQQARAGTYTLRISGIPPSVVPAKTIEVAGKDLKNVTIDVPLQVEIEGRIVVDGGQPLPATSGMIIEARAGDRASLATPQADGAFTLRLTGGETALTVRGIPSGYSLKSIHYGTKNITQKPMKVAGKPSRDALRITLQTQ